MNYYKEPMLSIEVKERQAEKLGVSYYKQTTRFLFMPGSLYIFLLFFTFNFFTRDSWADIFFATTLTTLFVEGIYWLVRKIGIVRFKKKTKGYSIQLYSDRIIRIKPPSSKTEYVKKNIKKIKHFPNFDIIYYKKEGTLFTKELLIPYESLDNEEKQMYHQIIATYK